jgi:hypothetical protein
MIAHELATALVGKHMGRISPITPTIDEAAALMKVGHVKRRVLKDSA